MKRIIDGRKYDTDTAIEVARHSNEGYVRCGDFNWIDEALYRKKKGEYFLAGEGGANTEYAERLPDNWRSGGERITPMSKEEAMDWAEKYMDADEFEAEFGPVEE